MPKPSAKKKLSGNKLSLEAFTSLLKPVFLNGEDKPLLPLQELEKLGINSPLILNGSETLRVKRLILWLKETCFSKEAGGDFRSYFGDDLSNLKKTTHLASSFDNLSLFSKLDLVVIHDAGKIKAAIAKPLIERLSRSHPGAFVILTTTSINTQTPLVNNLKKSATVVEVTELDAKKLARWIQKEARLAGASKGVSAKVSAQLVDSYGNDLFALSQQIAKLALLANEQGLISDEIASELIFKSPEKTSFELLNHLATKNLPATISGFEELLAQGMHPLQLSSLLGRSFRIMLALKSGARPEELGKDLGNAWFAKKLKNSASRYSNVELEVALKKLVHLDQDLKSSALPPASIMKNALSKIALRSAH